MRSKKPEESGDYVVYQVLHNDVVVYIGEGKDGRQLHAVSGTSHVYELNKLHFTCPDEVTLKVVKRFDNKADAVAHEILLIQETKPLLNKKHHSHKSNVHVKLPRFMSKHKDKAFKTLHEHYLCHYTVSECFGGIPVSKKMPTYASQGIYLYMRSKTGNERTRQRIFGQCVRNNIIEWFQEDGTIYIKLHSEILAQSRCNNPVKAIVAKHAGLPVNQL